MDYLKSLPWQPDLTASNCVPGRFYMINNTNPGFLANGALNTAEINAGTAVPPSSLRTIGDALNEKGISWAYYGGGFNAAVRSWKQWVAVFRSSATRRGAPIS